MNKHKEYLSKLIDLRDIEAISVRIDNNELFYYIWNPYRLLSFIKKAALRNYIKKHGKRGGDFCILELM